jgi:hypothetical protein
MGIILQESISPTESFTGAVSKQQSGGHSGKIRVADHDGGEVGSVQNAISQPRKDLTHNVTFCVNSFMGLLSPDITEPCSVLRSSGREYAGLRKEYQPGEDTVNMILAVGGKV